MRRTVATLAVTLGMLAGSTGAVLADPIDCPPGQAATHNPSEGGWVCVNNGGNANNSEDPKNPHKGKGDFRH